VKCIEARCQYDDTQIPTAVPALLDQSIVPGLPPGWDFPDKITENEFQNFTAHFIIRLK
jgi:hypothetical protein